MDMVLDIVLDAGHDTLALVPFLFATYLVLEALEHAAGDRVNALVRRAGAAGPVVGALAGVVPQCGFSAVGATLYAGRVATLGTLVAVLLSTSDEMLPMLLAERVDPSVLGGIVGAKVAIALVTGVAVDALIRVLRHSERVHAALRRTVLGPRAAAGAASGVASVSGADTAAFSEPDVIDRFAEAGEGAEHIHRLCEQDHCGCDDEDEESEHGAEAETETEGSDVQGDEYAHDHGHAHHHDHNHVHAHGTASAASIVRSAVSHTVQVSAFIFLVSVVLVALMETVGEQALTSLFSANEALAVLASALVGLIPNCSASVVITQLYLEGVLGFAPLMAGLLVSAGVGYLVLFRTNRHVRENVVIVALVYLVAIAWGFALMVLMP